jgi:hypothetical protein
LKIQSLFLLLFLNLYFKKNQRRQQYIGRPVSSFVDANKNRLYIGSDQHALACLNMKTGNIVWRKVFESNKNGNIEQVFWGKKEILVLNENGLRLQAFDYTHGFSNWEYLIFNDRSHLKAQKNVQFTIVESSQESESYYLTNGYQLCYVSLKDKACVDLPSDGGYIYQAMFEDEKGLLIIGTKHNSVQRVQYNLLLTSILSKTEETNFNWLNTETTNCYKSNDEFICEEGGNNFYISEVKSNDKIEFTSLKSNVPGQFVWSSKNVFLFEEKLPNNINDNGSSLEKYSSSNLYLAKRSDASLEQFKKLEQVPMYEVNKQEDGSFFLIYSKYISYNVTLLNLKLQFVGLFN